MEMMARDKLSSLFCHGIKDRQGKGMMISLKVFLHLVALKHIIYILMLIQNNLERLSLVKHFLFCIQ
jgi:hypothetical protein